MSWRKHENHREETKTVKAALQEQGINAIVKHGRGTSWGWLYIRLPEYPSPELHQEIIHIVESVTGRHGEFGNISIAAA